MANSNILMGGLAAVVIGCLIGVSYIPSKPKDEDVSYIQTKIANDEYYAFLSKYEVDNVRDYGTQQYVFDSYKLKKADGFDYTFTPSRSAVIDFCVSKIAIKKDDLIESKDSRYGFKVKPEIKIDTKPYQECLKSSLNSVFLTSDDLEYFAKDPLIIQYKNNTLIQAMISDAKKDNRISQLELMNIYLAAHTIKQKDLFESL